MTQLPSTEVAVSTQSKAPSSAKVKRIAQMAGAAALSFGLVGTFSLPAYAVAPEAEGAPDALASNQTFDTVDADPATVTLTAPEGEIDEAILEQQRLEREAKKKAEDEAARAAEQRTAQQTGDNTQTTRTGTDVPAGEGAQGLVSAALAQVGVGQDCTDLVQNSLAAIGLTTRRDQGGYDHGVSDFYRYGTPVTSGDYAPGDILIWPGAPHVAIYIGNGQAVHGGWGGSQTVVNTYASPSATPDVVRLG